MARKICKAGVVGSFSYVVLDQEGSAVASIRNNYNEIITQHLDVDMASEWTERKLRELIGRQYEAD